MHIFGACEIAFIIEHLSNDDENNNDKNNDIDNDIEYLSNDNKGNSDKKPHSSAHLLLILLEGIQRFGAGDWILRDL